MNIYIVIPAHNEEDTIGLTIASLANQTFLPKKVVVVNDNSTDNTPSILKDLLTKYSWLSIVNSESSEAHLPGTKIINAFYKGFETLDENYDVICKFDADIILPANYLESITSIFKSNSEIGMASGLLYIKQKENWIYETIASKDHVRGPIKAYRKACFNDIGGLKRSIGWDRVDILLAQYYGWKIETDKSLKVKHLKPTGLVYSSGSKYLQGEGLYRIRFGFLLTLIASLKSALNKRSLPYFFYSVIGYIKAFVGATGFIITKEQGKFIRQLSWKKIFKKVF